ncbi:hypothetical protein CsSME_00016402 [Camellia sinensis var. sinensis]
MVPSLKTGQLRKKALTSTITDLLAAIPLGSTVAPSPVVPVRSNVGPSHHVTSSLLVNFDQTQASSETQPSGVDKIKAYQIFQLSLGIIYNFRIVILLTGTSKPTCVRRPTLGKGI